MRHRRRPLRPRLRRSCRWRPPRWRRSAGYTSSWQAATCRRPLPRGRRYRRCARWSAGLRRRLTGTITGQYVDQPGLRAGNVLRLRQADKTYFFYAHMQGFADGITVGTSVRAGDVIGLRRSDRNALSPHLHLDIHPNGRGRRQSVPIGAGDQHLQGQRRVGERGLASPSRPHRPRQHRPMAHRRLPVAVRPLSALPSGSA